MAALFWGRNDQHSSVCAVDLFSDSATHANSAAFLLFAVLIQCELGNEQQQQANCTNGDVPHDTGNFVRTSTEGACTSNDL